MDGSSNPHRLTGEQLVAAVMGISPTGALEKLWDAGVIGPVDVCRRIALLAEHARLTAALTPPPPVAIA